MMPVSTLYDEYIDRPKLSKQKTHLSMQSPPPLKRGRNKKILYDIILVKLQKFGVLKGLVMSKQIVHIVPTSLFISFISFLVLYVEKLLFPVSFNLFSLIDFY